MSKLFLIAMLLLLETTTQAQGIAVKDNSDFALTLSQSNYNRLFIKGDEIWDFAYPKGAMALKQDKEDGSVYLMPASTNPFTLFLTTKVGRHFSVTVNSEDSLGKTIELIPQQVQVAKNNSSLVRNTKPSKDSLPEAIVSMITHMERHEPISGVNIKHQYGRAERLKGGLTLLPKEHWEGEGLKGEILQVYNAGREPLVLTESWFANADVKAIKFSKTTLAPKESAMLYRVQGGSNG